MENGKILSSLNYFSIFFLPFIFPLVVLFVAPDELSKHHAKRALISHIAPFFLGIAFLISYIVILGTLNSADELFLLFGFLALAVVYGVIYLVLMIWNVIQGIKVLR